MKKNAILFSLAMTLPILGCASKPTLETLSPQSSAPISASTTLSDLSFPLPPGDWREVIEYDAPGPVPHAPQKYKVLASISNGVIDRAIIVYVMRKTRFQNLWRSFQGCLPETNPDVHFSAVTANEGGSTPTENPRLDCWHVRSLSFGRAGDPHATIEALHLFAERERAFLPSVMVGARFVQKRRNDRRDYVEYLWNPDVLAPKLDGVWSPDDWRAASVAQDAAKSFAVNRIVTWAKSWRPSLLSSPGS